MAFHTFDSLRSVVSVTRVAEGIELHIIPLSERVLLNGGVGVSESAE